MSSNETQTFADLTLQLHRQYQDFDQLIDSMGSESVQSVDAIAQHMRAIKQTESMLKPLRDAYLDTGHRLSSELQAATDQTIAIVTGLMPKLARLEKATVDSAKRLFPRVQQSVRAVQMQNAYSPTRRA